NEVAMFMAAIIVGGVLFQLPLGRASDRVGRRPVITLATLLATGLCALAMTSSDGVLRYVMGLAVGGLTFPLYALALAWVNDTLQAGQRVAASSGLVVVFGLGAVAGPVSVAAVMDTFGPRGFYGSIGAMFAAFLVFLVYNSLARAAAPVLRPFRATPFNFIALPAFRSAKAPTSPAPEAAPEPRDGDRSASDRTDPRSDPPQA